MPLPPESDDRGPGRAGLLAVAATVSILQGGLLVLLGGRQSPIGVALAIGTILACWLAVRTPSKVAPGIVLLLLGLQATLFGSLLALSPLPYRYRLLHLAVALCYVAPIVASALWRLVRLPRTRAYLLVGSMAVGLFLGEVLIEVVDRRSLAARGRGTGAPWIGEINRHPELGYYHARMGSARSYYPDNPRGYFEEADLPSRLWSLDRVSGKRGRLDLSGAAGVVRVDGLAGELDWESDDSDRPAARTVRLQQSPLRDGLDAGSYSLRFRARADQVRRIESAVVWTRGSRRTDTLHRVVALTPAWESYELDFDVSERQPQANVEFRLGDDRWAVELAELVLIRLPGGERLEVKPQYPFFVAYSFNQLGCRGPDYPIPRPPSSKRLLVLGDSLTLGMGVHQPDTFASRLEADLRARASQRGSGEAWEVINCGVSGWATHQERLHYELIGSRYEPGIVLIVMHHNDVRSYLAAREKGYVQRQSGRLEFLLQSWGRIQRLRFRPPPVDFSGNIRDLEQLDRACRANHARLVVVIFRSSREPGWGELLAGVTAGLEGTDIPLLDLGPALLTDREDTELWVHPTDAHPNELAHAIAAEEIARFLDAEGLLDG